nr:hypothetical protein [Sphingobium sp. GW456-12-10-14-TSB1]
MSIFRHDTLGSWTRGGQAIVHNVRMTTQVFYQTFLASVIIWVGGIIWYALEKSSDYERFVLMKLGQAMVMGDTIPGNVTPILFKTPAGPNMDDAQRYTGNPALPIRRLSLSKPISCTGRRFRAYLPSLCCSGPGSILPAWAGARVEPVPARCALWNRAADTPGVALAEARQPRHRRRSVPHAFEPEHILICRRAWHRQDNLIIKMLDGTQDEAPAIIYDTAVRLWRNSTGRHRHPPQPARCPR